MLEDFKTEFSSIKFLAPLLTVAIVIFLAQVFLQILNAFSDIVLIIVFAWIISFLLEPLAQFSVKKLKIPLIISTLLVYLLFGIVIIAAFFFITPVIAQQVQILASTLPFYLKTSPVFIQKGVLSAINSLSNYLYIIPSVAQFIIYFLTTLVLSFYLIIERATILNTFHKLTPKDWKPHVEFIEKTVTNTMSSFFRVQVIFGIISAIATLIVMLLFGINFAPTTSIVAGILTVIPVIGTIIALIPPFLVALVQDPQKALFILAILLVAQQVIYNVLGPKLIGGAFKIHPIIVLLSLLIGLKVAGVWGSIFAIPLVAIATSVAKEILDRNEAKK